MPKRSDEHSREFCRKMAASNRVYRYEDIERASSQAVNPGWGANGANTYDLWLYKGGGNCRHFWERRVYLRADNEQISVNEARRIINKLPVDQRDDARLPVNDPRVAKRTRDQSGHGWVSRNIKPNPSNDFS